MDERRRRRVRRGAIAATWLAWVALTAAWLDRLGGRAQDDLFILYRYAWNLAHGHGLVYNLGERVFGLSEPGVALVLAALHRLTGVDVPALGSALFGASLLALATLVLVAARRRGRWPEALAGGTLLLAWSLVWVSHGAGAPLLLSLLVAAALLLEAPPGGGPVRIGLAAGALAGIAVWVRPDAAAVLAILAVLTWRRDRRRAVAFGAFGLAIAAAGAAAAWLYFGFVVPQTLVAKRTAIDAFLPGFGADDFWRGALGAFRLHAGAGRWLLLGLGAAGTASLWRGGGMVGRLIVAFAAVVAVTYSALGVGLFTWYVLPVVVALAYGFAFAVGDLTRLAARLVDRSAARLSGRGAPGEHSPLRWLAGSVVALAMALAVALPLVRASLGWASSFAGFGRLNAYRDAGAWIAATSAPDARMAALEVGVLGYYARRPLGDLLGLVSPESLPYLARGDLLGALRVQEADLVVARSRGRMQRIVRSPWFRRRYREAIRFPVPNGRGWVAVYRRSPAGQRPRRP